MGPTTAVPGGAEGGGLGSFFSNLLLVPGNSFCFYCQHLFDNSVYSFLSFFASVCISADFLPTRPWAALKAHIRIHPYVGSMSWF